MTVAALSVGELLLVQRCGFEVVRPVAAASVFRMAPSTLHRWDVEEVIAFGRCLADAGRLVVRRLREEAEHDGADGVVGVEVTVTESVWGDRTWEMLATGTAVKGGPGWPPLPDGRAFTSSLSGQEFWMLRQTGYSPVGLVMGSCVLQVGLMRHERSDTTDELTVYTEAFTQARDLARQRLREQAVDLGAVGVVGVALTEQSERFGPMTAEFSAVGTAVRQLTNAGATRPGVTVDLL